MFDIFARECAGLHISNAVILGKRLSSLSRYLSLFLEVAFVCNKNFFHIFVRMFFNFSHPLGDVVEGFLVGDVIHHHDSQGPTVVSCCDGMESRGQTEGDIKLELKINHHLLLK